jgi:hypothetical protein
MYEEPVAPVMLTQVDPAVSQRRHCCVYVIGVVPVHVPSVVVRVCPFTALPETTGTDMLTGAAEATTAVAAESADVDAVEFVAVTRTRIVDPTSPATSVYVVPVAPAMSAQPAPPVPQRLHWRAYDIGAVPVHVPVVDVSV